MRDELFRDDKSWTKDLLKNDEGYKQDIYDTKLYELSHADELSGQFFTTKLIVIVSKPHWYQSY